MISIRLFSPDAAPDRGRVSTGGDVIRAYLDDLASVRDEGRVTDDHYKNCRRSLEAAPPGGAYRGFADVIGRRLLGELAQADLSQWLRANPQWRSDETKRRNLAAALACFNWAVETGLLDSTPYKKTRRERCRQVQRRDATDAEAKAVFEAAPEPLRRVLLFVDQTGARTCEARDLLWDQVDWEGSVAELEIHKTSHQQQEPEPRIIGIPPDLLARMKEWKAEPTAKKKNVFLNSRGRVWTRRAFCAAFRKLRERLGLPRDLTPYCFRHRFATQTILGGETERTVGDLLGHRDPRTTRRYTHTSGKKTYLSEAAKRAMERRAKPPG